MKNNKKNVTLNSFSSLGGLVYSTDPDYAIPEAPEEIQTLPPNQQDLRITIDKLKGNKKATVIYQFKGSDHDLEELGKHLKNKCGVGGTVKNGEIILQGNCLEKVKAELTLLGYKHKTAGV